MSCTKNSLKRSRDGTSTIQTKLTFKKLTDNSKTASNVNLSITKSPLTDTNISVLEHTSKKPKLTLENEITNEKEVNSLQTKIISNSRLLSTQESFIEEKKMKAKMKLVTTKTNGLVCNMGITWFNALSGEFDKPYFQKLSKFVFDERKVKTIYPPTEKVFTWTQVVPINQVKVVIVGQDPYHGPKQAHGLCFSVTKDVAIPPSLQNMYKEIESSLPPFKPPRHGHLLGWAEQGVLLLNSVLTVRQHEANSHKDMGWERLTDAVMDWLNTNSLNLVFMLWGSYAQKKGLRINKNKHLILKAVHPSPLSAHRGFFGCNHFKMCNDYLRENNKKQIDWCRLP